jgi:hypothetical protein
MTSLEEIESAISGLSPRDRHKLVRDLPSLLPEWEGELAWARILNDPAPNAALSGLADKVDREFNRNPESFPEIKDGDFDSRA